MPGVATDQLWIVNDERQVSGLDLRSANIGSGEVIALPEAV